MPIYEYRCGQCGHEVELLRKVSDPPAVECPACHAAALQKKVTAAGFQLKGTGWYVTDFRGGSSGAARPEAAAASAPASATEAPAAAAGAAASDAPAVPAATATPAAPAPTTGGAS
ncbi:MAG: zinc ribbon domain-containing protein [Pseudomonadota bacterium]|nr:zinc ribbon domain-containing protein [Pseudomonadota bacterium]